MNKKHRYNCISNLILILVYLSYLSTSQPSCQTQRIPQTIPLQYGQQAIINLQQYMKGPNITLSVQPNNNYSNIKQQYVCKNKWNYQLGKILSTQTYEMIVNNKTEQFFAMLGGSNYFTDIYLIYYGINANSLQSQKGQKKQDNLEILQKQIEEKEMSQILSQTDVQVLQLPRNLITQSRQFKIFTNSTHISVVVDGYSYKDITKKMFVSTSFAINSTLPVVPKWQSIQSPIYLPSQEIHQDKIYSNLLHFRFPKMDYLLRLVQSDYNDYIQMWRWTQDGKQIVNLYDKQFFMNSGFISEQDIDLKMWQAQGNRILILDSLNGIHLVSVIQTGKIRYVYNLHSFKSYDHFFYDSSLQHLFVGRRGQIEQYEVVWLDRYFYKANRLKRYHLFGFQPIKQILSSNRFMYVVTGSYIHVIHLTNIQSNNQQYDGMYKFYPELYVQKLFATTYGFIKMIHLNSVAQLTSCQTHPPFLYLKAPVFDHHFVVNGYSTVNGQTVYCYISLATQYSLVDQQKIYDNGHDSQNETLFANRPGKTSLQIQKFGIGKNLNYDVILINHKINFDYSIHKLNDVQCDISHQMNPNTQKYYDTNDYNTQSIGNWIIRQNSLRQLKQFYKCDKYYNTQCNLLISYVYGPGKQFSEYQIIQEQKTRKQRIHEATVYANSSQISIQVNLVSAYHQQSNQQQNLQAIQHLCLLNFLTNQTTDISQIKLRQDKLYVLFSQNKQIRIYESLLSTQKDRSCRYLGGINVSAFKNPGIYFAPKHIDFDKQNLGYPYIVASFNFVQRKNLPQFASQLLDTIFISQFNQILVVRLGFNTEKLTRVTLLKQSIMDRIVQTNNISLIVSLPYILSIDYTTKGIFQYYFTHTYEAFYIRSLSFWYNATQGDPKIKLLNTNTLATFVNPGASNKYLVQVYELNSLVSEFNYFTLFQVQNKNFHIMNFNEDYLYQFVQFQNLANNQVKCKSKMLYMKPYIQLQINKKLIFDEPSKQQFYLSLFTQLNVKKHIVALQVASDSSSIERGSQYPYKTFGISIGDDQSEASFQIDDSKWFRGNIFNQRYNCQDCKNGKVKFQNKLSLQNQIYLENHDKIHQFYVKQYHQNRTANNSQFYFETLQGYLMTVTKPQPYSPWVQSIVPESLDIQGLGFKYDFAQTILLSQNAINDPQCIKAQPTHHNLYFVSMCQDYEFLDQASTIQIRLFSTTGFKSFLIDQNVIEYKQQFSFQKDQQLRASTVSQKQLIIISSPFNNSQSQKNHDVLIVRFYNNIWIYLIYDGKLELIQEIDQIDYGEDQNLCWIQLVERNLAPRFNAEFSQEQSNSGNLQKTIAQYGLICSLCQTGLYYMVFTIVQPQISSIMAQKKPLPFFNLITEQNIDLNLQLQKQRIQLPNLAFYLQFIVKNVPQDPTVFLMYTIIQNFNSFIWKVQLSRDTISISGMNLEGIIKRYNSYSPIQITTADRYFTVLYKSTDKDLNVTQFLAVYDKNDYIVDSQTFIKEFYFYYAQKTKAVSGYSKKSQIAQIDNNVFIMKNDSIKLYRTFNLIKVHVQRQVPQQIADNSLQTETDVYQALKKLSNENQDLQQTDYVALKQQKEENIRSQNSDNLDSKSPDQLYTQSIVMIVQTPTEVNSVTIRLYAYDYFELSPWEIFLIVFAGLVLLLVLSCIFKVWWKIWQKKRRLVKLQTTYLEDEGSIEREDKKSDQQDQYGKNNEENRQSQITTSDYPLNRSENRQSQITTSDSPFDQSILQKDQLKKPLMQQ